MTRLQISHEIYMWNSCPCPSLRNKHLETFFPGVYSSSESIGHADVCHALNANVQLVVLSHRLFHSTATKRIGER